ncbi:KH domain containing protein [Histomonas meleagridis]|uniref:KH domain containing protein n=1 Tax=Histomonas meleagridis TaxID=135588 RepID=UPI00355A843A|nr:KH domain containing protein [Histomonas meleagridis]KAH0798863.1 KH domain containing protein [Histomonas meleagridis]
MEDRKKDFIPFRSRETHWGPINYRPLIPNVATVLPPNLPEPLLQALMLRMQYEETQYKLDHLDEEADYVVWKENSLDISTWSGNVADAKESRAKEVLFEETRKYANSFEEMFPTFLPSPNEQTE